jgi:hypothetical protein
MPEIEGTYEVSAYIPSSPNLTNDIDYVISMNGVPLDTFRVNQAAAMESWCRMGLVELSSGSEVVVKLTDAGDRYAGTYMVADAIRFRHGTFDFQPPVLSMEDTLIYLSDTTEQRFVRLHTNEDCRIFLVPENTARDWEEIHIACLDSTDVLSGSMGYFNVSPLSNGNYWVFAIDSAGNISKPGSFSVLGLGLGPRLAGGIRIFPNPTHKLLMIDIPHPNRYLVEISSLNGKLLFTENLVGQSHRIDLSSFSNGVYVIMVRSGDQVLTEKIIKF